MQVKNTPIKSLVKAGYNPPKRSKAGGSLTQLEKSIEKIGLVYPIAVTKEMEVIDGHRRIAACQKLGWDTIPVIVVSVESRELAYAEVNANNLKLSGNDNLTVYLQNPDAVTKKADRRFESVEEIIGKVLLKQICSRGFSLSTVGIARRACIYVGKGTDDKSFLKRTIAWLIRYRNQHLIRGYMVFQSPPQVLYRAIMKNKDIRVKYTTQ